MYAQVLRRIGGSWKNSPRSARFVGAGAGKLLRADGGFADAILPYALRSGGHLQVYFFQYFAVRLAGRPRLPKCIHHLRSMTREGTMERKKLSSVAASIAILTIRLRQDSFALRKRQRRNRRARQQGRRPSYNGRRRRRARGLPLETYAVAPGTKFLVRLEDELGTKAQRKMKNSK